jgi:hypothetical protein
MDMTDDGIPLIVVEGDLDAAARGKLAATKKGEAHLAGDGDAMRTLYDALPSAIGKRLRAVCPPDFEISEVTMKMSVKGTPFGVGIEGDVEVTFKPKATAPSSGRG